ncbi:hypothetical protein DPMN_185772 [Dreissena polymorpha]|uniref:Uncharacterized protein n=1 Tax=Dreissena polymorpha TaxID=45954 RepID=A0A9D4DMW4_DREPO|nr:hypothetical protein DPMN_185772 [Dreissena polymorpha]
MFASSEGVSFISAHGLHVWKEHRGLLFRENIEAAPISIQHSPSCLCLPSGRFYNPNIVISLSCASFLGPPEAKQLV